MHHEQQRMEESQQPEYQSAKHFFPRFRQSVLFQRKRSPEVVNNNNEVHHYAYHSVSSRSSSDGSSSPMSEHLISSGPSTTSTGGSSGSGSLLVLSCLASAFMLLVVLGAAIHYYQSVRKGRRPYGGSSGGAGSIFSGGHKVLLLGKETHLPLERSFLINTVGCYNSANTNSNNNSNGTSTNGQQATTTTGRTKAVRSPSSGQVNPFGKKTPSPTTGKEPLGMIPAEPEAKQSNTGGGEINNNNITSTTSTTNPNPNSATNSSADHRPLALRNLGKSSSKVLNSIENLSEASKSRSQSKDSLNKVAANTTDADSDSSTNSAAAAAPPNLGKLYFKLKYSYDKRALSLSVIKCTDLVAGKPSGSHANTTNDPLNGPNLDPYVKIQLLPERQHKAKTRTLKRTTNPNYNEEFTFLGIGPNLLDSLVVHFTVLSSDRFSRDHVLGEVILRLNQFEFDSLEKQLTLVRDIAPRGNKLKVHELGELLVSLCYQPIANRLTVVILKARNLPKMDLTGLCDPYVKIYVMHKGVRLFKKRTHVKKRTLAPVFNESFIFDIPPEEGLDNVVVQFHLYDHDRVTRNELVGKVELGCKTGVAAADKHWNEVIRSPRRQIAEWHKLIAC